MASRSLLPEITMVKISILYPNDDGARFDFDYYAKVHMPQSIELLGAHPGFRSVSVERVIGVPQSGVPAPYVAMCHFVFDSLDDFKEAFAPHAATLQGDIASYTSIEPVILFSEVLIGADRRGPFSGQRKIDGDLSQTG
jgi:uncharacterized protein (TIGR02118 family)